MGKLLREEMWTGKVESWPRDAEERVGGLCKVRALRGTGASTDLGLFRILLELTAEALELGDAGCEATALLYFFLLSVEPEPVLVKGGVGAGGGNGSEMILIQGDGKGGVGRENELCVPLTPVPRTNEV